MWFLLSVLASTQALALPWAYGADHADKREVVKRARQAYYSLRSRGLSEFQSNVRPNWRLVLKDLEASNPEGARTTIKMLDGIHFTVSLDPAGKVSIDHHADVELTDAKMKEGFNQIFNGMQQALSGFFDSWSPFMLTSPFPDPNSDYQLESSGSQYRLTYKDGNTEIYTNMSKDLVISDIRVVSPAFKSSIQPRFASSDKGLVLIGYDASYQGTADGVAVQLKVAIENQEVSGLQLPSRLNLSGSYQGSPFQMELNFSNYQVKSR